MTAQVVSRYQCIGCSTGTTKRPHRYCRACRQRLSFNLPPDMNDCPTKTECRRAIKHALTYLR